MTRLRADLGLVFVAVLWGATFVVIKLGLTEMGPFCFIFLRFLTGALMMMLVVRKLHFSRLELLGGVALGGLLASGLQLQTLGLELTTASKAAFITGLSVVIVPCLMAAYFRRIPPLATLVGIILATAGLGFLCLEEQLQFDTGDLWVLASTFCFAGHIISVSYFSKRCSPLNLNFLQLSFAALLAGAIAPQLEPITLNYTHVGWGAVLFMGAVSSALLFSVQLSSQRYTTPTHAALIFALEPVSAAFFGWLILAEALTYKEYLGCGLIIVGMLTAELGALLKQPARKKEPVKAAA